MAVSGLLGAVVAHFSSGEGSALWRVALELTVPPRVKTPLPRQSRYSAGE